MYFGIFYALIIISEEFWARCGHFLTPLPLHTIGSIEEIKVRVEGTPSVPEILLGLT